MRLLGLVFLTMLAVDALAQEIGEPQEGRRYAEEVCANCHAIFPDEQLSPVDEAPSFQTVADTPGMTATALAVWLQSSHPTMPNIVLEPKDLDNVIAYILSLKK